jgi:septal ring factor EnvC (AmiA/AmiB activator)
MTQAIPTVLFNTTLPAISTPVTDLQSINTAITQLHVAVQQVHYGLSQCLAALAVLNQDSSYVNQQQYFYNNIALSTTERVRVLEESVEWLIRQNKKLQEAASEENGCNDSAFADLAGAISLADVSNLHNLTSHLPAPPPPSPAGGSK